jgi:hypothetical protein
MNPANTDPTVTKAIEALGDPYATLMLRMLEGWVVDWNKTSDKDTRSSFLAVTGGNQVHAAILDLMGHWGNDLASIAEEAYGLRIVNEAGIELMGSDTSRYVATGEHIHVELVPVGEQAYFERRGWAWPAEQEDQ